MTFPHSSRLAGLKDYVSPREIRLSLTSRWAATSGEDGHAPGRSKIQSWSKWAGQKIGRSSTDVPTIDEVHLFPGWATKRPHQTTGEPEGSFDVVLHVSGFATSRRTPEFLTRSQRAFLKLAKSFASIPKSQPTLSAPDDNLLRDFPSLVHLPPRPYEIPDDYTIEDLDAYFQNSGNQSQEADDAPYTSRLQAETVPAELARLHDNIESRLRLFLASSLPSRKIRVSIFLQAPDPERHQRSQESQPLLTQEMLTGTDGHFSGTFKIDWEDICAHPVGTTMTLNQTRAEHELLVEARIIHTESTLKPLERIPVNTMRIPITHAIVRVISDIDDTVKVSRVLDGARAIFNQVFVKDLEDSVVPEMGEWYSAMWKCGVRFHYVSNSPFGLLPVINEFISISNLPLGSVRLRSYAGRSLFNGLLSAPANRKRANVIEILDHFPDSQFLLIGDSGEQDLELYSSLAVERPDQISGVFIRNVSTVGLEDPTGVKADLGLSNLSTRPKWRGAVSISSSNVPLHIVPKRAASDTDISSVRPGAIQVPRPVRKTTLPPISYSFEPSPDLKTLARASQDSSSSIASSSSSPSSSARSIRQMRPTTEEEKRRWDLQSRVNKARSSMPPHIALRVFEDPQDCVEAEQIIYRLTSMS